MAFQNPPSTLVSTLIVILVLLLNVSPSLGLSTRYGSTRRLSGSSDKCGELVVQSQCSQNANCSWCRSKYLDDMCFSKAEAWRLPHQVYSCRLIRSGNYGVSSSSKNSVMVVKNMVEKAGAKLPLGYTQFSLSSRWGIFMRTGGDTALMFLNINNLHAVTGTWPEFEELCLHISK